ncbi:MAG: hypothetical protein FWC73_06530 [Defluviitaleaceae bacterium]|nr:hypothetical protein [Defluviitaleaceae bacterium]
MPRFWWPKHKEDENFASLAVNHGNNLGLGKLETLQHIEAALDTSNTSFEDVRSIPDVWCNTNIFEMILTLDMSVNHDPIVKQYKEHLETEWRALIAAIVLGKEIGVQEKPISPNPQNVYASDAIELIPNNQYWDKPEGAGWLWKESKLYVLGPESSKRVIAISSPITMLSPAADCWEAIYNYKDAFPWVNRREETYQEPDTATNTMVTKKRYFYSVTEPAKKMDINSARIMYCWLQKMLIYLQGNMDSILPSRSGYEKAAVVRTLLAPDDNLGFTNLGLIQGFMQSILQQYGSIKNEQLDISPPRFTSITDLTADTGFRPRSSDVQAETPNAEDGSKLLFIERSKVKSSGYSMGRPAGELSGYGTHSVQALITDSENGGVIRSKLETADEPVHILFDDEIFADSIYYIPFSVPGPDKNAKPNEEPERYKKWMERYIGAVAESGKKALNLDDAQLNKHGVPQNLVPLPFTPRFVKLLDNLGGIDEIAYNLESENDRISASVSIKVQSYVLKVEHTYFGADIKYIDPDVMCISGIWPSFIMPDCQRYYMFCHNGEYNEYTIKHLGHEQAADYDSGHISSKTHIHSNNNQNKEVTYTRMSKFPKVVGLYRANSASPIGYIPIKQETRQNTKIQGQVYNVAIDFGTSSTVIFSKITEGQDGFVPNEPFVGDYTVAGAISNYEHPVADDRSVFAQYFTPASEAISVPFQTLLHELRDDNDNADSDLDLFEKAHIYHKQRIPLSTKEERDYPDHGRIISDLKWCIGEEDYTIFLKRMNVYFDELFTMILLDARVKQCSGVRVSLSYPASNIRHESYIAAVKEQIAETEIKVFGAPGFVDLESIEKNKMTESEAAARFFLKSGKDPSSTSAGRLCVIDIGGGSSDIFYYEQYDNAADIRTIDSSIKLGARGILLDTLARISTNERNSQDPYLLKVLKKTGQVGTGNEYRISEKRIYRVVNQELNKFNANFEGLLSLVGNKGNKTVGKLLAEAFGSPNTVLSERDKRLRTLIAINLGAIFYYSGLLMRDSRHKKGKLFVKLAGNGSGLAEWIGDESLIQDFAEMMIREALKGAAPESNEPDSIPLLSGLECKLSQYRKLEAAEGMLCEPFSYNDSTQKEPPKTILGEGLIGEKFANWVPQSRMSEELFYDASDGGFTGISPANILDVDFMRFLGVFNIWVNKNHDFYNVIVDGSQYDNAITIDNSHWLDARDKSLGDYIATTKKMIASRERRVASALRPFFVLEMDALNALLAVNV